MKLAYDYSGLDFVSLLELDCVSYITLVRDAFVYKMKQTKEGRDSLEEAYILTQVNPDTETLRKKYG